MDVASSLEYVDNRAPYKHGVGIATIVEDYIGNLLRHGFKRNGFSF